MPINICITNFKQVKIYFKLGIQMVYEIINKWLINVAT